MKSGISQSINMKGHFFSLEEPQIMGILNCTPDSFHSDSRVQASAEIANKIEAMINEGATILDFGGQSTRPGATQVGVQEEIDRVIPAIELAKKHNKALVIHDRDSHEDVLSVLLEVGAPEKTIFHCYSGDLAMAKICVDRGYILSFAGTLTFKNAPELREAVKIVPVDQLLVETDSPFLAPTPHRGALNTPAQIANIVRAMADERDVSDAELATALSNNAERIFGSFE